MTILLVALPSSTAGPAHTQKSRAIKYAEAGRPILWACLTYVPLQAQILSSFNQGKMYTALNKKFISTLQRLSYMNSHFF